VKNQGFFLTKEGLKRFKDEYQELKRLKSFKVSGESPRIFHSEDINPEFLAYQEDLELLDARIMELEDILKNVQPITVPPKEKQGVVGLGAMITVEVDGQEDELEIVGTLEANPSLGRISNESPVGRNLVGRRVGDEVVVRSAAATTYKIKKIVYHNNTKSGCKR
jgi:transcription elongation factor GreA